VASADWLSILGAVTGVSGAVMGFVAYRRSGKFKAIDLRLSLRKAQSALHADADELPALLQKAKKSRERVASATGALGSGTTKHWLDAWEMDFSALSQLQTEVSAFQKDCSKLSHAALESELVLAYKLQRKVDGVRDKYQQALAQDDTQREQLGHDQRMLTQPRLGKGQ